MKIQLINTYSTDNLGDAAIYATLEHEICAHGGSRLTHNDASAGTGADGYISVGGDIFNNAREWLVTRNFARNVLQLARLPAARTMLFGQSIPRSCRGLAFTALAAVLRRLGAVSVRDEISYRRLIEAGVPARLGLDTVFALAPRENWPDLGRQLLESSGVDAERCALISLRSFDPLYRHDTGQLLQRLATLGQALSRRGHQPAILIQSDVDGADNDRAPAAWLQSQLPQLPQLPIIDPFQPGHGNPWEAAAAAAGAARMVIAVRYHAAIFRMIQGRAPFTLYYSNKGRDLVTRLGQPGCALDAFDPDTMVREIERSADLNVNALALRSYARADFSSCWNAIGGAQPRTADEVSYVR